MNDARTALQNAMRPVEEMPPVDWLVADRQLAYPDAVATMEERVAAIDSGRAAENVWLVEHPRSTPPVPAPTPPIFWLPTGFRSSAAAAAAGTPITGRGSGWPT